LGGGGLWGVSHGSHVLFKGACLINGEVASSRLASVDAVKASYGAVAQEARVFLGVGAFLGVFPGGVPRGVCRCGSRCMLRPICSQLWSATGRGIGHIVERG
jgi:hypothetical protein